VLLREFYQYHLIPAPKLAIIQVLMHLQLNDMCVFGKICWVEYFGGFNVGYDNLVSNSSYTLKVASYLIIEPEP